MSHLFNILPFVIDDSTLPVIPEEDIERLGFIVEPGAYDLWVFGGNSDSLVGAQSGRALTPQSSTPAFEGNHMVMSTGVGNALLSDFPDSSDAADTVCIVARLDDLSGSSILMTMGNLDPSDGYGSFVGSGGEFSGVSRGAFGSATNIGVECPEGEWFFWAVSRSMSAPTRQVITMMGDLGNNTRSSGSAYSPSANPVAIGNGWNSATHRTRDMRVAELIIFPSALNLAQMQQVYERSKLRMAARGIALI